ncbi:MAG: hypothetical protein AB7P40_02855 [Chloroflexota bacterium]
MSETSAPRSGPYVGPRPFTIDDKLYGRERERRELEHRLIADRIILLHSPSGAGKTSLIEAGLIPALTGRLPNGQQRFHILPRIRVNRQPAATVEAEAMRSDTRREPVIVTPSANRYLVSTLLSLNLPPSLAADLAEEDGRDLSAAVQRLSRPTNTRGADVFIFDQFEEILTLDPFDVEGKRTFFRQIGRLLEDRSRWAVFAAREEYLAELLSYARPIPTRFENTFRLDFLTANAARDAIIEPSANADPRVVFEADAADKLVRDLSNVQVQLLDGRTVTRPGRYVESVQLQVVCERLWAGQDWAAVPDEERKITTSLVEEQGDVTNALRSYYATRVAAVANDAQVDESAIRAWFRDKLISPQGLRLQVLRQADNSANLPNEVVDLLDRAYLVRRDSRGDRTWYELAHDRLLEPVQRDNAEWFSSHKSELQQRAERWLASGQDPDLLYTSNQLPGAERWAVEHRDDVTPEMDELLRLSRQQTDIRQRYWTRVWSVVAGVAILLAATAAYFALQAYSAEQIATDKTIEAQQQRDAAGNSLATATRALMTSVAAQSLAEHAVATSVVALATSVEAEAKATVALSTAVAAQATAAVALNEAQDKASDARQAEAAAQAEREEANSQRMSVSLAVAANGELDTDPERSLLLSLAALEARDTAEAKQALNLALERSRVQRRFEDVRQDPEPSMTQVNAVAYNQAGSQIATASDDGRVRIWDAATGALLHVWPTQDDGGLPNMTSVAFISPDSVVTGDRQGLVRVWNVQTGVDQPFYHDEGIFPGIKDQQDYRMVRSVAVSANGRVLVTGGSDAIARVWSLPLADPPVRLAVLAVQDGPVTAVAVNGDGTLVATGSTDHLGRVWDVRSPAQPIAILEGHSASVIAIAFDHKGTHVATGGQQTARVWDARTGRQLKVLAGHKDGTLSVAFSWDDAWLATSGKDRIVRIWNIETEEQLFTLNGHAEPVMSVAFAPTGVRQVATGSADRTARVWNAELGLQHAAAVRSVAFSQDGTRLGTTSSDGTARIWDTRSRISQLTLVHREPASPGCEPEAPPPSPTATPPAVNVQSISFSRDGSLVATSATDGWVRLWDGKTSQRLCALWPFIADPGQQSFGPNEVDSVEISPDGSVLAAVTRHGELWRWRINGRSVEDPMVGRNGAEWLTGLSFSPDGMLIATADYSTWQGTIWPASDLKNPRTFPAAFGVLSRIAFGPDGLRVAMARKTGDADVWEVGKDQPTWSWRAHGGETSAIAFDPNPARISVATGGADRRATVWTLGMAANGLTPTTTNDLTFAHAAPVNGVAFSAEGPRRLATAGDDGWAHIFLLDTDVLKAEGLQRITRWLTVSECTTYLKTWCPPRPSS